MARKIEATLKLRMDNIRDEVPSYWRKMAPKIEPEINLDNMRKVLKGRSHRQDCIEVFEKIVQKQRLIA